MSKSTGGKGSSSSDDDNDSKGGQSSSSSSSPSKGGGNGGNKSSEASSKAASEAQARADAATKASAESASKAQAEADAKSSQAQSQHQAAVEAVDNQQQQSAQVYGSYVQDVLDAAPVRDAVGVSMEGEYGTIKGDRELSNAFQQAHHEQEAQSAWGDKRYGDYLSNKALGSVDRMQGWGYEQAREITQAPLDKMADIARNPAARGLAMLVGGVPGLALTSAIGVTDSIMDYAQGENTGKKAAFQGLGDLVGTFGPPGVQMAYNAVANPVAAAKQGIGMMVKTGNPIADMALQKGFGYAAEGMVSGLGNPLDNSMVMGESLTAKRNSADNNYASRVTQTTGTYTRPQVMGNDAMLLEWQKARQQQMNKPRYSSSLLFNLS